MLAETHIKVIKTIYNNLSRNKQRLLDVELLIIGSVQPDIDLDYKDFKHDYESTKDLLMEIINDTITSLDNKQTLSYNIGIISHFLTDYCSSFHSNKKNKKRGFIPHILYELEVDELIRKNNYRFTFLPYFRHFNRLQEDLESFIQVEMQQDEHPIRDIKKCFALNEQVINLILDEYINNRNNH